jgi:hypothetical protein
LDGDGAGGLEQSNVDTVQVVDASEVVGRHNGGSFVAKLTAPPGVFVAPQVGNTSISGIWRDANVSEAYFGTWYYLSATQKVQQWEIQSFGTGSLDGGTANPLIALDLRQSPLTNGDMLLFVFDSRGAFNELPIPAPPPLVPINKWFHVEVFYRNAPDGHMVVWLDGVKYYDFDRNLYVGSAIHWRVENSITVSGSIPVYVYIDDVAISQGRITPSGILPTTN